MVVKDQEFANLSAKVSTLEAILSRIEQYREPDRQIWAALDDDYSRLVHLERLHEGMAEDIANLGHRVQTLTGWAKKLDTELAQLATIERVLKIHNAKQQHDQERAVKDAETEAKSDTE